MLLFTYKREVKSWKVEVGNRLGEKPTLDKRKLSFTRPHLTRPQIWHHVLNIGNTQSTYTHTQKITSKLCGVETRESTVTGAQLQTQLHCLVTLRVMDSVFDHVRPNGLCKTRNSANN